MFGFSLVSIDAEKIEPLVILAGGAGAFWWLWTRAQSNTAQAAAAQANTNATAAVVSQAASIAALQRVVGQSYDPPRHGPIVTYSGPNASTGNTTNTIVSAPFVSSASTKSNGV